MPAPAAQPHREAGPAAGTAIAEPHRGPNRRSFNPATGPGRQHDADLQQCRRSDVDSAPIGFGRDGRRGAGHLAREPWGSGQTDPARGSAGPVQSPASCRRPKPACPAVLSCFEPARCSRRFVTASPSTGPCAGAASATYRTWSASTKRSTCPRALAAIVAMGESIGCSSSSGAALDHAPVSGLPPCTARSPAPTRCGLRPVKRFISKLNGAVRCLVPVDAAPAA